MKRTACVDQTELCETVLLDLAAAVGAPVKQRTQVGTRDGVWVETVADRINERADFSRLVKTREQSKHRALRLGEGAGVGQPVQATLKRRWSRRPLSCGCNGFGAPSLPALPKTG